MIVERLEDPSCPATLTIHFKSRNVTITTQLDENSSISGAKGSPTKDDAMLPKITRKEIRMKGQTHTKILDNFLEATKAKPVICSEKDNQEIQWLERVSSNSLREANIMKIHNEKKKKQEEMLSAAKGVTV
ncbi:putative 50s ribosomal protein mrp49 [Erysiphe necator]|uniref:Putative 50s ribosomal protein mrp49 n=1 Tax=Uncinula necator TaxID=52586 RepID=A0A0B1PAY6_UNCNE|nr:putative 50s ribosomal protein mrp49 [Erysiphe necator]